MFIYLLTAYKTLWTSLFKSISAFYNGAIETLANLFLIILFPIWFPISYIVFIIYESKYLDKVKKEKEKKIDRIFGRVQRKKFEKKKESE